MSSTIASPATSSGSVLRCARLRANAPSNVMMSEMTSDRAVAASIPQPADQMFAFDRPVLVVCWSPGQSVVARGNRGGDQRRRKQQQVRGADQRLVHENSIDEPARRRRSNEDVGENRDAGKALAIGQRT